MNDSSFLISHLSVYNHFTKASPTSAPQFSSTTSSRSLRSPPHQQSLRAAEMMEGEWYKKLAHQTYGNNTHFFIGNFSSEPGVANEILENESKSCLMVA